MVSGLPAEAIATRVPPACRREVEPAPAGRRDGDDLVLDFPEWRPRRPARHLLPALSALTDDELSFRFELQGYAGGEWSPWVAAASIGPHPFTPACSGVAGLTVDVDVYQATAPVERVKLRLRVHAEPPSVAPVAPWLVTLSACDLELPSGAGGRGHAHLDVAPLSQMEARPELAARICSPTSVAMVLRYYGIAVDPEACAADMFHPGLDLYGVWPAAIRTAGRRGALGYLLRFPDWSSAAWCLRQGLPIIASVRYAAGELTSAAIVETSGHLLVLTGYDGSEVWVNDPAAPSRDAVPRRYRLDELRRVWLERTGVGYVFFRP